MMLNKMIMMLFFITATAHAQKSKTSKEISRVEAKALYDVFKQKRDNPYVKKQVQISGVATFVGPNVFGLPSVELSEGENLKSRVICVLPFGNYLDLRKVSKKDRLLVEGEARGYSEEYDIIVVKKCKFIEINDKKI